jgi:hypothetical protein
MSRQRDLILAKLQQLYLQIFEPVHQDVMDRANSPG